MEQNLSPITRKSHAGETSDSSIKSRGLTCIRGISKWRLPCSSKYSFYQHPSRLVRWYSGKRLQIATGLFNTRDAQRVVDLGCGYGFLLPTLSGLAENIIGLDRASEELCEDLPSDYWRDRRFQGYTLTVMVRELLRAELGDLHNVTMIQGDARSIPLKGNTVDGVFCLGLLEHVPRAEEVILDIKRILTAAGVAVFALPVEFGPVLLSRTLVGKLLNVLRDSYSLRELIGSVLRNRPPSSGVRDDTTHRGYDYRQDLVLIGEHLEIEVVRFFPIPIPGLNALALVKALKE